MRRIISILVFLTILSPKLHAQDKSNRGKEFWLAYGFDYSFFNESPVNAQELAIYISTIQAATVTVTITNTGYSQTLNIPANTVDASILIPKTGPDDARTLTDGLQNRNIHIVSTVPVAVYAHVYASMVSGATMLMPVETYGYSYFSVNYYQTTSQSNPNDWYSWFYAVASEDNTRLEITPSDTTKNGWLPGQTYTINLNRGESFHVFGKAVFNTNPVLASKDMTGSKVISVPGNDGNCHPFALFSGSGGIRLCRGDGGEFMHQQVFPAQAWGTRYLTYHTINNTNTNILETNRNYYRVCVQDPSSVVRRNGVVLTGLIKNFFYEFMDSTGGDYIESNKPILVSQYTPNKNQCWNYPVTNPSPPSYGDPEMFYLSPIEQGQKSVLFYTSRKSTIDYVYANIHLPTSAVNSLLVDGNPVPSSQIIPHPNYPSYSVALTRFIGPAAQHTISCDSSFTSTVYGLGNYESYGYNVGTLINNLNYYSEIKNSYNTNGLIDTFTCPKSPVRLYVKLAYPATTIHWKLSQVSGITPNADSIIASPIPVRTELINNRTYFVYTLNQDFVFASPGTYYIPVTYTSTVIENCSQSETAMVKIVVKPGPVADFTFPNPACLTDSIHLVSASNANGYNLVNYNWLFPDNSTANTINAVKLFSNAGNQQVKYTIYADNGCLGDTIKTVSIRESPQSSFTISGNTCQQDSVRIIDASTISAGTINSWQWNFGDGNAQTNNNNTPFYHTYSLPGNYIISLITVSNNGCKSDTAFVPVTILPKPVAAFTINSNICLGDSILITDASSSSQGIITTWEWNFGDGNSQVRNNNNPFYHPYTIAGTFTVSLIIKNSNGCNSDTLKKTITVSGKPVATFTHSGKACVDSIFTFISSIPAGSTNSPLWQWNFGDGQTFNSATTNQATHTYTTPSGSLTVKHWVSYSAGCNSDTSYVTIPLINSIPVASFTISGNPFCERKSFSLNSAATGVLSWNWNLGSSTSTSAPPFSHSYSLPGNYSISLVVGNAAGCFSSPFSQPVTINPRPAINAGPDKFMKLGNSVTLDATINNSLNYNFTWTPPLFLSSATVLNPTASPDVLTTYKITATDKLTGCTGDDYVTISPVTDLFVPTGFTPNNDGRNDKWNIPGLALYPEARVIIYNRGGQKIYDTKGYYSRPWDGRIGAAEQPSGIYIYMIQLNDDQNQLLKGTLTLIR